MDSRNQNSLSKKSFQAAEEAYMDLTEMQSLLPNNLIVEIRQGSVNAVNADTGQTKAIYPQSKALFFKTQDKWNKERKQ